MFSNIHPISKKLREHFLKNESIKFEEITLIRDHSDLEAGDTYIAGRNRGIHLLTVRDVRDGLVISQERNGYPYNIHECYKVQLAI